MSTTGERISAPPLGTTTLLVAGGIALGVSVLLAVIVGAALGLAVGPDAQLLTQAAVIFVAVLLTGVPFYRSLQRAKASRSRWEAGELVEARRFAADSRSLSISVLGISGFLIVVFVSLVFITANNGAVQSTFLRWDLMVTSALDVVKALGVNIIIAICAQILAMAFGLVLALGRLAPGRALRPIRALSIAYIDVLRGLPAIVVIYLVCFGLPLTDIPVISEGDPILYAIIALTLTYSAYLAELFRSGIESIHPSQISAALSLGLTPGSVTRKVVLPQMVRRIAAPLLSYFIALQKDTALVNIVGIVDAFSQAKIYSGNYFNLSAVTVVCIVFVLITIPQTRLVDYLLSKSDGRKLRGI